jgi:hypothetical protein
MLRTPTPIRHYVIDDVNAPSLGANLTSAIRRAARSRSHGCHVPGSGVEFDLSVKCPDRATGGVGRSLRARCSRILSSGRRVRRYRRNFGSIPDRSHAPLHRRELRITSIFRDGSRPTFVPGGVRTHREPGHRLSAGWESTVTSRRARALRLQCPRAGRFTRGVNDRTRRCDACSKAPPSGVDLRPAARSTSRRLIASQSESRRGERKGSGNAGVAKEPSPCSTRDYICATLVR